MITFDSQLKITQMNQFIVAVVVVLLQFSATYRIYSLMEKVHTLHLLQCALHEPA